MSDAAVVFVAAAVVAIGMVGILVPVMPGASLVVVGGYLIWAWHGGGTDWIWFGAAALIVAVGAITKWVLPQRSLKTHGIPVSTQLTGAALAVVGFFVVPVIGLFLGFVLGVWLAELRRLGPEASVASTRSAINAALSSMGIEFGAAVLSTLVWLVGLLATTWA